MFLYGASGIVFAIRFLDLRVCFPRVEKAVIGFCSVFGTLIAAAFLLGSQKHALLAAFTFTFLLTGVMLFLGIISVRAGQKPAKYFLIAALAAMAGALLTTLSTWGFIPHNSWTFRAVEIGMPADATLLALALGYQFRVGQEERLRAERLAQLDPLTGLTASFGVAQKNGDHVTLDALIEAADNCLHQSREQGRNRVTSRAAGLCSGSIAALD